MHTASITHFPNDTNITSAPWIHHLYPDLSTQKCPSLTFLTSFSCNRGVGILSTNHSIVCFCPPHYYGNFCQYHADRLSILLHLDLSQSIYTPQSDVGIVIKLLVLFLFHDQVLDTHTVPCSTSNRIRHFHQEDGPLLYSRSPHFRQHRMQRYHNRSYLIETQPYSIRIEAYESSTELSSPVMIGVWHYPIAFDHLPVFRFAKVLHLTRPPSHPNPCSSHPCPPTALCQPLINDHTRHICLCKGTTTLAQTVPSKISSVHKATVHLTLSVDPTIVDCCEAMQHPSASVHSVDWVIDVTLCMITVALQPCQNNGSCFPTSSPDRVVCVLHKILSWNSMSVQKTFHPSLCHRSWAVRWSRRAIFRRGSSSHSTSLLSINKSIVDCHHRLNFFMINSPCQRSFLQKCIDHTIHHPSTFIYLYSTWMQYVSMELVTSLTSTDVTMSASSPTVNFFLSIRSVLLHHPLRWFQPRHRSSIIKCVCQKQKLLCFRDDVYVCICADDHSRVECFRYDYESGSMLTVCQRWSLCTWKSERKEWFSLHLPILPLGSSLPVHFQVLRFDPWSTLVSRSTIEHQGTGNRVSAGIRGAELSHWHGEQSLFLRHPQATTVPSQWSGPLSPHSQSGQSTHACFSLRPSRPHHRHPINVLITLRWSTCLL